MRYLVPIGVVAALVVGLVVVKFKQISGLIKAGAAMQAAGPPPETVGTSVASAEEWEGALAVVGSVAAVRGVAVSTEGAGVVTAIHFESGAIVRAGQVLVELDTSVERAQLASAKARKELASVSADRSRKLADSAAISKAQLDTDEAQVKTTAADFGSLQAQIDRKVVRAPFAGRLGIRNVNLGQYLSPGTPVTSLESLGSVYVDFSLPQQQLSNVHIGAPVRVRLTGSSAGDFSGTIGAIDPAVDPITRTIKLRASVPNRADALRPGMFVNVTVVLEQKTKVVVVPSTAVVHATYGDSVFIVEPKKDETGAPVTGADGKPTLVARQQFVKTGVTRGDFISVTAGVAAGQALVTGKVAVGDALVTAGAFKLRNGATVVVNNEVKPTPSLEPAVENR